MFHGAAKHCLLPSHQVTMGPILDIPKSYLIWPSLFSSLDGIVNEWIVQKSLIVDYTHLVMASGKLVLQKHCFQMEQ